MQVQRGLVTLTTTIHTVTLDTPVPVGKSFPMITTRQANHQRMDTAVTAVLITEVAGAYTQIQFQRARSDYNVTVAYEVITGDEFTVQSGVHSFSSAVTTSNVTIDAVDLAETFVVTTTRQLSTTSTHADQYFRVRASLTNGTTLNFSRHASGGYLLYNAWYVVSMAGATVQQFTSSIPTSGYTTDVTITEVNRTRAFLVHTWQSDFNGSSPQGSVIAYFVNNTTVRCRLNYTPAVSVTGFVISHPKLNVVSGLTDIASGVSTAQEYAGVDNSVSFVVTNTAVSTTSGLTALPGIYCTAILGTSYLDFERNHNASDCELAWFVVEWRPVIAPSSLSPDNVAVMPNEQNTFTWSKDASMTATAYEWGYREVGAASWIDSGKIISSEQKVVVAANTFTVGKSYEWRIRHWDDEQVDPSDWVYATFNTSNPVIVNPTPVPDSSIRVEIRDLGAKLKSPYQRDIQLTILISDNPDFTSPTVYSLPEVASGEVATVQHAFQLAGYWYVRMVATDTESLQTVLEYQIFVSHQLFFKEPPEVTTHAPRATHVTVRVRGTTTEFTAVVTPPPPLESRIERLIMIDSGDQATCQAVAERLLEKWGRPQVSIKGTIPLTLVLRPRQKVRIVIPEVGLNEDLVLQRRQHVIEGVQAYTQITVGDIQLSESELVARTIDALEGQSAYVSALGSEMVLLGQELSEREIADIEQGQQLSDTDITVIEMGGDDAID